MKYGVVYRITNDETGKCYIGRTKGHLYERWYAHCQRASNCSYLKRSIAKYGRESFSIVEIASSWDEENLKELEMCLISQENTLAPHGYNLINTGGGISEVSEETRQKLSTANKGRIHTADTKRRMSEGRMGIVFTEEHKRNMSRTRIGRPSRMKGQQFSEEARANMGGQNRGKTASQETKDKMSAVRVGMKWYTNGIRDCRFRETDTIPDDFRPGRTKGLTNLPESGCRGFQKKNGEEDYPRLVGVLNTI